MKLHLRLLIALLFPLLAFAQPKYEFRAVWVATVDNIDWPSKKTLTSEQQQKEFIDLLDLHKANGMNAIIAQIRPATDAFYPSPYEPWSEWLTGTQGKPPAPYYDPLEFMVRETHKRNMEFHAWFNPYRAVFSIYSSSIAPNHITRVHPEWFLTYGDKRYFDPGNKDAQSYVTNVVRDVVKRYDIDAVHFDDYFYPYKIPNRDFPDSASFRKYGNGLTKDEWRRSNVDSIIVSIAKAIKEENKLCKFGISPFGVWRNKSQDIEGSNTKAGVTNYDELYADILLWLRKGWIDYVAPQIYWEIGYKVADYELLTDWWANHTYGRQLYIGHGFYRTLENRVGPWKTTTEIPRQIQLLREYPQVNGSIYFSSKSFVTNPNGWNDSLKTNYYRYPALVPPMKWIDSTKPSSPVLYAQTTSNSQDSVIVQISNIDTAVKGTRCVVYLFNEQDTVQTNNPKYICSIVNQGSSQFSLPLSRVPETGSVKLAVTALSKTNNESELSNILTIRRTTRGWETKSD